jgi:hypothetical protein
MVPDDDLYKSQRPAGVMIASDQIETLYGMDCCAFAAILRALLEG